ncbi:MAG: division/cell wall cluster transcriptional repressor MraZ [Clostridia bacterium]|nr:division/cell wall cluster transcriptional repressor MraZ [Clostridia bacterium]
MGKASFSGSYDHSLDSKGRVIIPASYREALGENFTVTINPSKTAVAIYPEKVWEEQLERLSKINPMDKKGMQYVRFVMSISFADNSMDSQGRVLIPAKLRSKIGLTKDIVFVGINTYIEIWDAEAYRKYDEETDMDFDEVSDYVYEQYNG